MSLIMKLLLLFNNNEHCLEHFVCLFSLYLSAAVGGKKDKKIKENKKYDCSRLSMLESVAELGLSCLFYCPHSCAKSMLKADGLQVGSGLVGAFLKMRLADTNR